MRRENATVPGFPADAAWMERALSPNTLTAYRAHLTTPARWLAERGVPLMRTSRADPQEFIVSPGCAGARPHTTASELTSFRGSSSVTSLARA
jgi:integrase/recombinase XerD